LVPSFSSKGFKVSSEGRSEIETILASSANFLTETYLISAYDVGHKHLPAPRDLPFKPELLFLDSGGYEVSGDRDLSCVQESPPGKKAWTCQDLKAVLDDWPPEIATVLVSYDHPKERKPFVEQVAAARELFKGRPHLWAMLIKPQSAREETLNESLAEAMARADELGSFDLVGVTEKEIGRSPLERMEKIARLRRAMDEAGLKAPIHVFGALDPLSACLYFLAGAEVFDGLTWIRYAYEDGRCVYASNNGAMKFGLHVRENEVKSRVMANNVYALQNLQQRLREFDATRDFNKLSPHNELLKNAADSLQAALKKGAR
jgi:hypothetical protein